VDEVFVFCLPSYSVKMAWTWCRMPKSSCQWMVPSFRTKKNSPARHGFSARYYKYVHDLVSLQSKHDYGVSVIPRLNLEQGVHTRTLFACVSGDPKILSNSGYFPRRFHVGAPRVESMPYAPSTPSAT
jgi:hypothetical protein